MIKVDLRSAEHLVHDLRKARKSALPHATRDALNSTAFMARKTWIDTMRKEFTLRNQYTTRSVRVERASGTDTRRMVAVTGSIAEYMDEQESGNTKRKRGEHGVPIPTPSAAGQAVGAKTRIRVVRKANYLSAIRLGSKVRQGRNRRHRNAMLVGEAVKTGNPFVFLDLGRRKGLFRVTGKRRIRVTMLWDLSRPTVKTPPSHTLQTTLERIEPLLPVVHREALIKQMRRHKLFGY